MSISPHGLPANLEAEKLEPAKFFEYINPFTLEQSLGSWSYLLRTAGFSCPCDLRHDASVGTWDGAMIFPISSMRTS
jgi:hypothetical protein